jgi:hypothetical protein
MTMQLSTAQADALSGGAAVVAWATASIARQIERCRTPPRERVIFNVEVTGQARHSRLKVAEKQAKSR